MICRPGDMKKKKNAFERDEMVSHHLDSLKHAYARAERFRIHFDPWFCVMVLCWINPFYKSHVLILTSIEASRSRVITLFFFLSGRSNSLYIHVGLELSPSCDRQMRVLARSLFAFWSRSLYSHLPQERSSIRLCPPPTINLVRDFPQLCVRVSEYSFPKSVMAIKIPPS